MIKGFQVFLFFVYLFERIISSEELKEEVPICGGFIEFDSNISQEIKKEIDYSSIQVQSFTNDMILKDQTFLAQSGYYFLPIYENESFILKINGPNGMSFEPEQYVFNIDQDRNIKQICVGDINFKFKGFSVAGNIITRGSDTGPEGVNLGLFDKTETTKIQTTKTVEGGNFYFKPIIPGSYIIKPIDTTLNFERGNEEFKFNININKSNFFNKVLVINGFKLIGSVEADQDPLENVLILIYSLDNQLIKNFECEEAVSFELSNYPLNGITPFCVTTTNNKGLFTFSNIPFGKFTVRPYYADQHITYEVEPELKEIQIEHSDFVFENPFQVTNFSIFGKVVNSLKIGIPNVTIKIDGQVKTITDKNGIYKLEHLSAGNYDLEATADDYFFEPLTNLRITAHLKYLPDVVVTDYRLCGKILIESSDHFSSAKRTVVLIDTSDKSTKKERRTITDIVGNYCFEVKPGKYMVHPVLSQEERDSDLHLQPEFTEVIVVDRPFLDINFYQSKVIISGSIICLEKCDDDLAVELLSLKTDKFYVSTLSENNTFLFNNILSGHYKLSIKKSEWCWEKEEIILKVQNSNILDLVFNQTGFSMFFSSSHDIKIKYTNTLTKLSAVTTLDREKTKICLPNKGIYKVQPISCQKFDKDYYYYNTNSTERLNLIPQEFLVKGEITMHGSLRHKITLPIENFVKIQVNEKLEDSYNKTKYDLIRDSSSNEILYQFYAKSNTFLILTPVIEANHEKFPELKNLIFFPKQREVTIDDDCLDDPQFLSFETRSGLIIEGIVTPQMNNVTISAFNQKSNELVSTTTTNSNGNYKIGPLYNEYTYVIKAFKEGYKIIPDSAKPNNFIAEKLSFLRVKVVDTQNKSLSSVFLSLSSSDRGFKINNITNTEGYYDYVELYSGDYYVKPLFKEYRFEPPQKFIKIQGGQHYEEKIIAHRIAFSVYGKIYNLNKEKVEGLYIQAFSTRTRQIQETSIDKNGEYRLRGLVPGHEYELRVKIPNNNTIEKALPVSISIKINQEDVNDIDFVVLQKPKKIDIRGYLNYTDEQDNCPASKVVNVNIELSKIGENNETVIIATKSLNYACQFLFRNLEKDKYTLKFFEKPGPKQNHQPKMFKQHEIDLNNDTEINGGVYIMKSNVETHKKISVESLNYSIYSPIFLFLMVMSLLKFEYTVWVINKAIILPFEILNKLFAKKRKNFK